MIRRILPALFLTLLVCSACDDPQHGAFHTNRGIWLLLAIGCFGWLATYKATRLVLAHLREKKS